MTEAIISAVVKKLADLLADEVRLLSGVNSKVEVVKLQLGQMRCFLKDAESTKKRGDERILGWVRDVRSVAYETEDAIDTFLVEANRQRLGFIRSSLLARRALGKKISQIQAKLGRISDGRTTFGIKDLSEDGGQSESLLIQPSFKHRVVPDVDHSEVVGFEAEKKEIINLLLLGPSDQSRCVVSIVGPGGAGKTTLAHKLYNCSTVRNHFDSCLWITVSQNFNLLDVLKNIHKKLVNQTELKVESEENHIVFLLGEVNTLLKQRKYLIVLDDVWTEHVFTQLKIGLVDVKNGSRVLMTTRNLSVANNADPSGVYHLRLLSEEESLVLFLMKAIPSSNSLPECPEELKDLARKLVQRCNGLPLAVIVLGGLLSSKPCTHQEWSRVLERLDWHVIGEGKCMKILATSYEELPYLHKSCFRYLACYPEDYTIEAEPLLEMWIAEGLIDAKNKGELEDYAEDYLEELVQRCLVQVVERSPDGAIESIRVHDLLREVALGEAKENDSLLIWKKENAEGDVSMTRQLAFHENIDESSSINQPNDIRKIKMPKLRTFINFNRSSNYDLLYPLKTYLQYVLKSYSVFGWFRKDSIIEVEDHMMWWLSEGMTEARTEGSIEDYAQDYLEKLEQRCLIQVVERFSNGAIKAFRVHEMVFETRGNMTNDLRISNGEAVSLVQNFKWRGSVIGTEFLLLGVLELQNTKIRDLPTDLKNMIHLRYLGLSWTYVTVIPSWIGHLQNLQTFNIVHTSIVELPESFWKIPSLRHVHSSPYMKIVGPPSTANLVNLRSIGCFQVPKSWMKSIPRLPGVRKLQLFCNDVNDGMLIHNLISKLKNILSVTFYNFYSPRGMIDFSTSPSYQNLHTMNLTGYIPLDPLHPLYCQDLLHPLYRRDLLHPLYRRDLPTVHIAEIPPNLVKLTLKNFHLNDDPMPKLEKLHGLKFLELDSILVGAHIIVCTNGGFSRLQSLKLHCIWNLMEWKVEDGALPVLKYLLIQGCFGLRALPDLQYVTTLQELRLDRRLHSKIENKSGEEWNKVKHVPTISGNKLGYVSRCIY